MKSSIRKTQNIKKHKEQSNSSFVQEQCDGPFDPPPLPTHEWSSITTLVNQSGFVGIAGSGNVVHAVYSGFANPPSPIMYLRSTNEGATFAPAVPIGNNAVGALYLEDTVMADGNLVAVCYYNNFQTINDFAGSRDVGNINIIVSNNGGTDFQTRTPVRLNTGVTGFALRHSIAISGNNIHVVWMDFRNNKWDIYYRRSTDAGATWDAETLLVSGMNGTGTGGSGAQRPQIATNGDTVHVTWMDGRDNNAPCVIEGGTPLPQCTEIYYTKSANNGRSFLKGTVPLTRLTTSTTTPPTYSGRPDIATDGLSTVYVLYDKRTPGLFNSDNDIFLRRSANGKPFESPFQLTNDEGVSTHSSAVFAGGVLWTVWIDSKQSQNPNPALDYKVYSIAYNGDTSINEQLVSSDTVNAGAPILGASKTYIHAIWGNTNEKGRPSILYSRRRSVVW